METKYWLVDLTSDHYVMNVSMARVPGASVEEAEQNALKLLADPEQWRVTGIDRA